MKTPVIKVESPDDSMQKVGLFGVKNWTFWGKKLDFLIVPLTTYRIFLPFY